MSLIAPDTETHRLIRGVDTTITHRVLDESEAIPAVTAASSAAVVYDETGAAVTSSLSVSYSTATGALSATVAGADTAGTTLVARPWSVHWSVTLDTAVTETHERRARLVRRAVPPTLLSSDLVDRYPELGDHRATADLITDIATAWEDLQTDLEVRGVLVDQVTSPAWLHRAHYLRAASDVYARLAEDSGDLQLADVARDVQSEYHAHLSDGVPYDADQDDVEDTSQATASDEDYFWRTGRVH